LDTITIEYYIKLPDDRIERFELVLDAEKLELIGNIPRELPTWTQLDFHKCPNCPLNAELHPVCPVAANLANIVKRFDSILSFDEISVVVITKERRISQHTTTQRGVSSLMGLVIATSGCPHTSFFKPMARFHLPFASQEETIYRAVSTYLLAQYFRKEAGEVPDLDLTGLKKIYHEIHRVNTTFADRLRAATDTDSSINAIVNLDMYAKAMPYVIEDALEETRRLFSHFLTVQDHEC